MTEGVTYSNDDDWDDTIFTATGRWDVSESSMVYVSYSEGFRSGGFSIRSARDPNEAAFDPEEAYQLEVGVKNQFFDRRLTINASYFYLEREGSQFSSIINLPPGSIFGTTTIINNGGNSEISGFELETLWVVNEAWSVSFNGGILDVDNQAFPLHCDVIDNCATGVGFDPSGTPRNFGGNSDSRQPEWNVSLNISYGREMDNGNYLSANVGAKKVGDFLLVNTGGAASERLFEGGYSEVDARIQIDMPVGDEATFSIALFGKNLTDSRWREQALFLGASPVSLSDGGSPTGFQGWGAPETWGLEFTVEL